MKVSTIVSTYSDNRYYDLIELMDALRKQINEYNEIIIIIDANQHLYTTIKNHALKYGNSNIKVIFNPENKGLSHSRNIGIHHSNGDILAFIDDDAIPCPDWTNEIIKTFLKDDKIGAVTGDVIPVWEDNNMSWFPKELHWMISCSYTLTPKKEKEIERGFGTNMAFRRKVFQRVGEFNTKLGINGKNWVGGEDTDMFLRVKDNGTKIIFNPDIKVYHKISKERIYIKNLIKRAINGGFSVAIMKRLFKYNPSNSTEKVYLKNLLFKFYMRKFKDLIIARSGVALRQLIIVTIVLFCEFIGYSFGLFSIKNENTKE